MKILVIGGSYFFGRWFVQVTYKDHDITLLNRGNIRTGLAGVRELTCDRHDAGNLKGLMLSREAYDVVVDFCAYEKGDIRRILELLDTEKLRKYIFISTVDVYKKTGPDPIDEDSAFEDEFGEDPAATYIAGKVELEHELRESGGKFRIKTVSVRPSVLYGPLNYAPREGLYFEWIDKAGQIIHPMDADGFWQMIYIEDAARALLGLCELKEEKTEDAYNFCTDEIVTYELFEGALEALGKPFEKVDIPVGEVEEGNIPLPFPLRASESAIYSTDRYRNLVKGYTPLCEGLARSRKSG